MPETSDASTGAGLDARTGRGAVRGRDARVAAERSEGGSGCCPSDGSCCRPAETAVPTEEAARRLGYSGAATVSVADASTVGRLETSLTDAGFEPVNISPRADGNGFTRAWDDASDVSEFLVAATITARKPTVADE